MWQIIIYSNGAAAMVKSGFKTPYEAVREAERRNYGKGGGMTYDIILNDRSKIFIPETDTVYGVEPRITRDES